MSCEPTLHHVGNLAASWHITGFIPFASKDSANTGNSGSFFSVLNFLRQNMRNFIKLILLNMIHIIRLKDL